MHYSRYFYNKCSHSPPLLLMYIRNLFNSSFKTNPYLERALLTGITRISKESIFSDLNNMEIISITSDKYADCFGFTEKGFYDSGSHPSEQTEPERFYHGFVLGLIVDLTNLYYISSNRESGFGHYDVVMETKEKDLPAIIMEFKVFDPEEENDLQDTVKRALS